MSEPVEVTVYRRENCHLCESALETIERVADDSEVAVSITEIDVDTDESLAAAYGDRVPHILIDGADAFSYRVHAAAFRTELRAAADSVGSSATE
jgi:thiol-disulfide isomerase/thioredoxin